MQIKRNKGSALISALFIMTLVAIAATAMSKRLQIDIHRTELTLTHDKLILASQAVTFWAMDQLAHPQLKKPRADVAPLNAFPKNLQHIYPGVLLEGRLEDLQAHFNLNNLMYKKWHRVLLLLLKNTSSQQSQNFQSMVTAIYHWISPYDMEEGTPQNLTRNTPKTRPYSPAHQLIQSKSELRLIPTLSLSAYRQLFPIVTALPEVTPINALTASPSLLSALGNGLNQKSVKEFIALREANGYEKADVLQLWLQKNNVPLDQITFISEYYLCITTSSADQIFLTTYTLLKRKPNRKNGFTVSILSQSINTL